MNIDTGQIRRWDSLTPAERASGQWVKLPPHDTDGYDMAGPADRIATLSARPDASDALRDVLRHATTRDRIPGAPGTEPHSRRGFDALGRPR